MIKLGIKDPNVKELKLNAGVAALVDCANSAHCVTLNKNHALEKRGDDLYLIRKPKKACHEN